MANTTQRDIFSAQTGDITRLARFSARMVDTIAEENLSAAMGATMPPANSRELMASIIQLDRSLGQMDDTTRTERFSVEMVSIIPADRS
jgi:hypothetical protein